MTDGAVAILAAGSETRKGGQGLRWSALHRALGQHRPCEFYELRCDRWQRCAASCAETGRVQPAGDGTWWYDRAFCDRYADRLVSRLSAAGVSTVVCSGLDTYRYASVLAGRDGFRVVFDMHNVELPLQRAICEVVPHTELFTNMHDERHLSRVEAAEGAAIAAAGEVWACSPEDRLLIVATYPGTAMEKIRVVPNVVDVAARPDPAAAVRRVCFTGRFDYYPNLEAGMELAGEVAPLLDRIGHDIPVVLAGAAAATAFDGQPFGPNVRIVCDPEAMAGLIAGSVMAVPLTIGGGSRFKILEAFAAGAPVVSTAKGVEGLDVVAGVHYLPAESTDEFAGGVDRLVRDCAFRAGLVRAAWQLVRDRYSVDALADQMKGVTI